MNAQTLENEVWERVIGTPYCVSSLGRVRRDGGKILKPRTHTNGYHRVSLGAGNDTYVHRLVCHAFYGSPPHDDAHADHINGVRSDNRAVNLRWLSPEENRALRKFCKGQSSPNAKVTDADVRTIRSRAWFRGFDRAVAQDLGVSRETVRDIRLGKVWRHV